jgi:hypothetical protein
MWVFIQAQVSIEFGKKEKENKRIGINVEHNTKHTHEYSEKCVRIWNLKTQRVTIVCFKIQKRDMNIQRNAKHAARKTQPEIDRQVENKTHDIDSWKQANRQGMCVPVRETEAIIGRAPRLGIHTWEMQTPSRVSAKL